MQDHGPVVAVFLLWNSMIVVADPAFVKEVLVTDKHKKPYTFYRIFNDLFGTRYLGKGLVSEMDPDIHAKKRALLNPAFHRKYLIGLMGQFNSTADLLVKKLTPKADGKTEVAMLDELSRATLDAIAKVAFNMDLNCTLDDNSLFNRAVAMTFKGASGMTTSPSVSFSPLPSARRFRREVRDAVTFLRETGRECITQRQLALANREDVPNDILTLILKEHAEAGKDEETFDIEYFIDEFMTFFIAGQETTANLLAFTLLELGNHPDVMYRLKTEVEAAFGDKDKLEYSDLSKLHYMLQVLKEVLRLWPPVAGTSRVLAHDVTVKGYKIYKGTIVTFESYVMSRMKEFFHDPLQFDPDRFKASDDKPQYAYFPFSLGSRNCIGQQFAMIEARVLLAKLLHKFNFDLLPGQGYDIKDELTIKPAYHCKNYLTIVE